MPFFSNKFSPLKCPARQKLPFHSQNLYPLDSSEKIKIKLGNVEYVFHQGEWTPEVGMNTYLCAENEQLKEITSQLKEENNFLKLKIDILLDMLAEETMKGGQRKEELDNTKHC